MVQKRLSEEEFLGKLAGSNAVYQKTVTPFQKFIQPFNLFFHQHDFHVMLYFEGHPEYEAVEAMIEQRKGKEPLIRAIITRHDQTQIDHINDRSMTERTQVVATERETYYNSSCHLKGMNGKSKQEEHSTRSLAGVTA